MHFILTLIYNANLPTAPSVPLYYYSTDYKSPVDMVIFCLEPGLPAFFEIPVFCILVSSIIVAF